MVCAHMYIHTSVSQPLLIGGVLLPTRIVIILHSVWWPPQFVCERRPLGGYGLPCFMFRCSPHQ